MRLWFHEIIVSHQNIPGYNILIYRLTGSVRLAYLMTQITATMMKAGGDDVVDLDVFLMNDQKFTVRGRPSLQTEDVLEVRQLQFPPKIVVPSLFF